jgi:RNA polymerase-binding transcription factor DksA
MALRLCERCGSEIPTERLEAVPNAVRCTPCESRRERRQLAAIPSVEIGWGVGAIR